MTKSSLVIVYHRQPYEEVEVDGDIVFRENKSPNGVVPALKGFFGSVDKGCWIAWKQSKEEGIADFQQRIEIDDSFGQYEVFRIPMTEHQVKSFYHVTSKEALWPILHSFPWMFNYGAVDWETFRQVNKQFADAAIEQAADDAIIWVHDYNLWLVPSYIRQKKPNARIAFFHHTPFPSADIFNILPWREEIVDSLLCCDLLGFHIPRYAENFAGVARSLRGVTLGDRVVVGPPFVDKGAALSEPTVIQSIEHEGRTIEIDAWPIGTNPAVINEHLSTFDAGQKVFEIRNEIGDQKLLVSVGRVDYVKGSKQLLEGFDRLLKRRPDLKNKIKLFLICVAPAMNTDAYRMAQEEVEQLVGAINGKHGNLTWTPIMLSTRPVPFNELVCYYRAADVCWTPPLRDGLNLVAKEFIAAQNGEPGALVLSEFAGAAAELPDAIMTNPYSHDDMDRAIDDALDMPLEERRKRMDALRRNVENWDVHFWADHVMARFEALRGPFHKDKRALKKTTVKAA
ncbi:MAG: glucosylglycerol-phosphate synthase [Pseudomonadota bacterium]